jgi:hypothetical protein
MMIPSSPVRLLADLKEFPDYCTGLAKIEKTDVAL